MSHCLRTMVQTNCKQKSILEIRGTRKHIPQCRKVITKKWLVKWNDLDCIPKKGWLLWTMPLSLSKGDHKWDARSNHCTLFFDNICPLNDSRKDHSTSDFEVPCWVHCQLVMFDPPSHKVVHGKHNTLVSNPLNDNGTRVKFHQMSWNIVHIPKWKQTNLQARAWEKILAHPQVWCMRPNSNVKIVEHHRKEMLHSSSHFHLAPINISFEDSCILMTNNKMWEITQQIVDVNNWYFLGPLVCKCRRESIIEIHLWNF